MVLQFNPPTDLVNAYLNRPSPGQEASSAINQALQTYVQSKAEEHKQKNEALQTLLKASDSVDLSDPATAKAFAPLYKDAGVDPSIFNPSTPPATSTATVPSQVPPTQAPMPPVTAGTPDAQGQSVTQVPPPQPISPIVQASLAAGHPDHAGIMNSVGDPNQLIKTGFGRKKLAAAESAQKLTDAQQTAADKAEENGPKSFDYAKAFAKNAGAPNAANDFIALAQKDGRNSLTKREMDDIKNSINVSAQQGRGQYFSTMGNVKEQTLRDSLIKEARNTLDPYFNTGAGKQQAVRLNNIGRAEALVTQMKSQVGGGDSRQMRELATSLGSVLTGGNVVAQNQIEELLPQTYKGNFNKFVEKLSNNPTGTDQQAFINRFADTLGREKSTIQQQARTVAERTAPTLRVLKSNYPEDYNAVVNQYLQNSPDIMGPSTTSGSNTPLKIGRFTVEVH